MRQVPEDLKEIQVFRVRKVQLVHADPKDQLDALVQRVRRDVLVKQDQLVVMVVMVLMDQLVQPVLRVTEVPKEDPPGLKVQKVLKVIMVMMVFPVVPE